MTKTFEQECEAGWFDFNPDRSLEERCEIVRRTSITEEMTWQHSAGGMDYNHELNGG